MRMKKNRRPSNKCPKCFRQGTVRSSYDREKKTSVVSCAACGFKETKGRGAA